MIEGVPGGGGVEHCPCTGGYVYNERTCKQAAHSDTLQAGRRLEHSVTVRKPLCRLAGGSKTASEPASAVPGCSANSQEAPSAPRRCYPTASGPRDLSA